MKSSQFDFWPILGKLVTRKKTIFPNRIEVSQPHWSCRGWTSNSRCAVCFEISRRQRGTGTSSGSIIALCTISTWRYRVCRLLQRDESGRWNVRLANSVPPPMATRRCRCYRGSYTRAKATGLFESDINDDRSCVSRGFLFFFFLFFFFQFPSFLQSGWFCFIPMRCTTEKSTKFVVCRSVQEIFTEFSSTGVFCFAMCIEFLSNIGKLKLGNIDSDWERENGEEVWNWTLWIDKEQIKNIEC